MDFARWTAVAGITIGLALLCVTLYVRSRNVLGLLLVATAMVVGPLSPLLGDRIPESARMGLSITSIVLACAGIASGAVLLLSRLRRLP